jgi:hypothetical protein
MSPRDTTTGAVLEATIKPCLKANGYSVKPQKNIGEYFAGKRHMVDLLVEAPNGKEIPVSVKWQQVTGTAEQKIPFEVIKMIHAVKSSEGRFVHAYIILGGSSGWTLKDWYLAGYLAEYIRDYHLVSIVSLEEFITLTNRKQLEKR